MILNTVELIKKKRSGLELTTEEIQSFIKKYTSGEIPDYQTSAFLMATFFKGMTEAETLSLTKAMLYSGNTIDLSAEKKFKVDKHSTGGVGDKTSLILGPVVSACGYPVPMISGRGLGHTGGTLDKLESIPGFDTQISVDEFKKMISEIGISFIGQTKDICPADKKMYALRDVTATVECLPLICASILSKKIAEGIDGIVFDVKFGTGAFMKTLSEAQALAKALVQLAKGFGKKSSGLITSMNQPLGAFAGNSLEMKECISILKNENQTNHFANETAELSLILSAEMMFLSGDFKTFEEAKTRAEETLKSGKAYEKFEQMVSAHKGKLIQLPLSDKVTEVTANRDGFIHAIDGETIGWCGVTIGAGRKQITDKIEPTAGFEFHKKIGDSVKKGEPLVSVYGKNKEEIHQIKTRIESSFVISQTPTNKDTLVIERIT